MPEISIYKSPWKAIRLILLSTPFVIFSLVELSSTISISYAWMNWFSLCFFGLGVLMGLFNLLDRRPEMILNEEGIFDRMTYGIFDKRDNRGVIKWNSIKDVSLHIQQLKSPHGIPLSKKKYICIDVNKQRLIQLDNNPKKLLTTSKFQKYVIPIMNLKNFDEQKFIELVKIMSQSDVSQRQKLLNDFKKNT